jgi:hypothetical protein
MRNDSIETLLLRHYGSTAAAPPHLEEHLSAIVRQEVSIEQVRQQPVQRWGERRVSRRRLLQLMTFSGASAGILAVGVTTLQERFGSQHSTQTGYAL